MRTEYGWRNFLYSSILCGILISLICFLLWRIDWFVIRLWITLSLIFGTISYLFDIKDEKKEKNEKAK